MSAQDSWDDWQTTVALGAAGYAVGRTPVGGTVIKTSIHAAARGTIAARAIPIAILGTPIAGSATGLTVGGFLGLAVGSIGLGYASGAAVGSVIAHQAFGDEGARKALDFYSDPRNVYHYYKSGDFITDAQSIAWSFHDNNPN